MQLPISGGCEGGEGGDGVRVRGRTFRERVEVVVRHIQSLELSECSYLGRELCHLVLTQDKCR